MDGCNVSASRKLATMVDCAWIDCECSVCKGVRTQVRGQGSSCFRSTCRTANQWHRSQSFRHNKHLGRQSPPPLPGTHPTTRLARQPRPPQRRHPQQPASLLTPAVDRGTPPVSRCPAEHTLVSQPHAQPPASLQWAWPARRLPDASSIIVHHTHRHCHRVSETHHGYQASRHASTPAVSRPDPAQALRPGRRPAPALPAQCPALTPRRQWTPPRCPPSVRLQAARWT